MNPVLGFGRMMEYVQTFPLCCQTGLVFWRTLYQMAVWQIPITAG